MADNTEKVIDTAADITGEMAQTLGGMEDTIRSLNRTKVQFYALGMVIGGATGALIAWKIAYSRAEAKYSKIMDEEIAEMREHYRQKGQALEAEAAKGDLGSIVKERGYTAPEENEKPPMVVKPPTPSRARESQDETTEESPDEEDLPGTRESIQERARANPLDRNIFREQEEADAEADAEYLDNLPAWDWHEERRRRSPDVPYVIHVDEREELDYQRVDLHYYEGDDVLCDDHDTIIDPDLERNRLVGDANLARFGHGSEDANIVYIRNDKLELIYQIDRTPKRFGEEVHGFHHYSDSYRNLERMRVREKDEQEE